MQPTDFILAKRRGETHSRAALESFLGSYLRGEIPDYQVAAWLMAVCWRGMGPQETTDLTLVMADSGDRLDLSDLPHTVDKHSTGGVGDKTSLVLAPLLAACGATVAKMSGRGLGHTGGTVDKLESVPGFRATLSEEAFLEQAHRIGVVVTGQSKDLAPADGLLYALRDATGTVESLPLIASSIMSKKLAGGAESIVLDVKVGSGAFMKTLDDARELAQAMLAIGQRAGRRKRAVLSTMEQPLGRAVGNALEVEEAYATLRGEGPDDLRELCLVLAEEVLDASELEVSAREIERVLDDGRALERFERWVEAQGGEVAALGRLELAPDEVVLEAPRDGAVSRLDALSIGRAVARLGGGRTRKEDAIDHGVGVTLHAKIGDLVGIGDPLASLRHRGGRGLEEARQMVVAAITLSEEAQRPRLILERLEPQGV